MLDAAGLRPRRTPSRIVALPQGARLHIYSETGGAPALLIVPAPFKQPYIWDLLPEVSVVRRCLEHGLRVHLLEWPRPGPADDALGLDDYADRFITAALDAIGRGPVLLAGHSVGGTLAAIYASLYPERVRALLLVDAPLAFADKGGPIAWATARLPHARGLRMIFGSPMPGSAIDLLCTLAAPDVFQAQRLLNLGASLSDRQALAVHLRVERWTLDESPMPGRLFEEVIELLYREDRFLRGTLDIGGKRAAADRLRAPVLAVLNPGGRLVPPESIRTALPPSATVLTYEDDGGAAFQHMGPLVGPSAHARLWPAITAWAQRFPDARF